MHIAWNTASITELTICVIVNYIEQFDGVESNVNGVINVQR